MKGDLEGILLLIVKNFWINQWLKFNDAIVTIVDDIKSEVLDLAMPYVLFYRKKIHK